MERTTKESKDGQKVVWELDCRSGTMMSFTHDATISATFTTGAAAASLKRVHAYLVDGFLSWFTAGATDHVLLGKRNETMELFRAKRRSMLSRNGLVLTGVEANLDERSFSCLVRPKSVVAVVLVVVASCVATTTVAVVHDDRPL